MERGGNEDTGLYHKSEDLNPPSDANYKHEHHDQGAGFDALAPLSSYKHGWLYIHPAVVRALGSVEAAVLIHKMLKWSHLADAKTRDGWFYASRDQITVETGLTRDNQETARKRLIRKGMLEEREYGNPCRLWYRVNHRALHDLLAAHATKETAAMAAAKTKSEKRFPHPPVPHLTDGGNFPNYDGFSVGGNPPNKQEDTGPTSRSDVAQLAGRNAPNLNGGNASDQLAGMQPTLDSSSLSSSPASENHSNNHSNNSALAPTTTSAPIEAEEQVSGEVLRSNSQSRQGQQIEQEGMAMNAHAKFVGHQQQGQVSDYLCILRYCRGRQECWEIALTSAINSRDKGSLRSPVAMMRVVAEKYLAMEQSLAVSTLADLRARGSRAQDEAWERHLNEQQSAANAVTPNVTKILAGAVKPLPPARGAENVSSYRQYISPDPRPQEPHATPIPNVAAYQQFYDGLDDGAKSALDGEALKMVPYGCRNSSQTLLENMVKVNRKMIIDRIVAEPLAEQKA